MAAITLSSGAVLGNAWMARKVGTSGLSWGKLGVKIAPHAPPHPKVESFTALAQTVWRGGPFRTDLILYLALFCVTLLGPWVYSLPDVCKSNSSPPATSPHQVSALSFNVDFYI